MAVTTLFLTYRVQRIPVKRKTDRDLLWYDAQEPDVQKRLKRYRGGQLVTKYDPKTKRRYVEVSDLEETAYERRSNEDEIRQWVSKNGYQFGIAINDDESNNKGLAIDVDDSALDIVEHSLDRQGFVYDTL